MGRFRIRTPESEKEWVVELWEENEDVRILVNDCIVARFYGKTGVLRLYPVYRSVYTNCDLPLDEDGYIKVEKAV